MASNPTSAQRLFLHTLLILSLSAFSHGEGTAGYYGRYIGPLSRLNHGVSGEVYAVDARTLHIRDFTYDGEGPAAFFYAGNTKAVGPGGFFIRDETGSNGVLKRYNKKHITITLPEGKTLNSIRWFSVWCEEFAVNFGDIQIPRGLDFPKPQKISALSGVHGVSSENIVIVDAQTLLIPSFSYDGEAPDAKFWVGRGPKPSPQGIRVPDENGKQTPLRRYDRKTIVLTLPGDLTIFDIGHFGVWCEAFTVDFGHVQVPPSLNVPPSLKMLGVSPQKRSLTTTQVLSKEESRVYPSKVSADIRPTTYRPPTSHRFGSGVQLQQSVSLTPDPIVFFQQPGGPLVRQQPPSQGFNQQQQDYRPFDQQQHQLHYFQQNNYQQHQQQNYRPFDQQKQYHQNQLQQQSYRPYDHLEQQRQQQIELQQHSYRPYDQQQQNNFQRQQDFRNYYQLPQQQNYVQQQQNYVQQQQNYVQQNPTEYIQPPNYSAQYNLIQRRFAPTQQYSF